MIELLAPRIEVTRTASGLQLTPATPLPPPARCVGDWLVRWARERPAATFLAERDAAGAWARTTYAGALAAVEGIAASLPSLGAGPGRPVMILSENSVAAALLTLGALHAGVPVSQVSAAYSLQSASFGRLREVAAQLRPGVIFADDPARYAAALAAIAGADRSDARDGSDASDGSDRLAPAAPSGRRGAGATLLAATGGGGALGLDELARAPAGDRLAAFAAVGPDTLAKVLFTSGSTGRPRGVVNTQRMLTANQESLAACWPFLAARPPVVVDWLPWSHTFGGNHNFFLVLRGGGALYIDGGRPAPALIGATLRNLADVAPTLWFNVPRGFDQAAPLLEADPALAAAVFRRLDVVFYAAAALSPATRARLERVAAAAGRPEVFFTSSWGSTETAPLATSAHFPTRTTGVLGVPVPGVTLKLAPVQDRLELRVRGPNVTPGHYLPGGGVAPIALDEEGFLPTGDAGRLVDEARPEAGVAFVGRLSENFKLSSGTWVCVAQVRLALVDACAPLLLDAVIAGQDQEVLGALLVPSPAARALPKEEAEARLLAALAAYNAAHPAGSERAGRAILLEEPLSLDEGETTDKGYTNQRRVLERRRAEAERLFADPACAVADGPEGCAGWPPVVKADKMP